MENPNYILKFNELIFVPKNESTFYIIMKRILFIVILFVLIGTICTGGEFFRDMSYTAKLGLILYVFAIWKMGGWKENPSYCELQFYDEYLIFCRPATYYNKKHTETRFYKLYYGDIQECLYCSVSEKIRIYGITEFTLYRHDKTGAVDRTKPMRHTKADSGFNFYTCFSPEYDFVKEIEEHSPLKVKVEAY